jgi:poly-beta-1,6-N-acetyl-D-glucosamine synthase
MSPAAGRAGAGLGGARRKRARPAPVVCSMDAGGLSPMTSSVRPQPGAERVLIVSPVYNEGKHLDRTARAIAAQERPPDQWVIVDDGSRDDTLLIARRWMRKLPYLTVMSAAEAPDGADRLALAREARAFNLGLREADWRSFTHIGKLDGDVELPPHWFATLLARFRAEPALGLAGGRLEEPSPDGWQRIAIPDSHIHGAVKLYSRECLQAIGGIEERLAWDTIDETYARMRGYETRSLPDLVARHHRHWGSADGRLRGRARHGQCAWVLHQSLPWALLRSVKLARVPPAGLSGAAFAYGYLSAAARRTPRVEDPQFRRFVRRELRGRLLAPVRGTTGRRRDESVPLA